MLVFMQTFFQALLCRSSCSDWSTSKSSIGWTTCGGYDTGYAVSDLEIESEPTDEGTESGEP